VHDAPVGSGGFPARLLDDYLLVAKRRSPGALPATALRTRSLAARALLAHAATGGSLSLEPLLEAARRQDISVLSSPKINASALDDLARVVSLQNILPHDQSDGMALYQLAFELFGPVRRPLHQGLHAELAFHLGYRARAARLCEIYTTLPEHSRLHLRADLLNPFTGNPDSHGPWLRAFQDHFSDPKPALANYRDRTPFDCLSSPACAKVDSSVRISVVITSYRPQVGLITTVQSLIDQTWANVELIIVDDASPPEYDALLKQCVDLDQRVRLIKLRDNSGTYIARNVGMAAASGQYVTFQDSDDWSHPRRLERQVRPLLDNGSLVATTSDGLRATTDLIISRPGRLSRGLNTSSLMICRDAVTRRIGYFDEVRKSSDTEYVRRIEAAFGASAVKRLRGEIYAIIRDTPRSLSSADFRAGWVHPARLAYRSAYALWHEKIKSGAMDGYLPRTNAVRPFPAPAHLNIPREHGTMSKHFDVIFASDWRPYGGPQKSMIEEIEALTRRGMRVAIVHMEAYRFMTEHQKPLCTQIQELVNRGTVDHVLLSDDVSVSVLVIRYPPVLQFADRSPSCVRARRVIILANQAPSEVDGTDLRYVPSECMEAARKIFGVEPRWCPQGPAVRAELVRQLEPGSLMAFDMPAIIDVDAWVLERTGFRSTRPVIGRHSRDNWTKWPEDGVSLLNAYPATQDFDVRVMGGSETPRALLGTAGYPPSWLVYGYDEIDVRTFLFQIDFYVYFPHPNMIEAFGRAILEALASGCVAILARHFEATFGNGAVYCTPADVQEVVRTYYGDKELFLRQCRRAQERVREVYSHDSYFDMMSRLTQDVDCARATDKPNGDCCREPDRPRLLEARTGDCGGTQGNDAAAFVR
jgi:glycosyltransferase involved in cell wall biosynthesis